MLQDLQSRDYPKMGGFEDFFGFRVLCFVAVFVFFFLFGCGGGLWFCVCVFF